MSFIKEAFEADDQARQIPGEILGKIIDSGLLDEVLSPETASRIFQEIQADLAEDNKPDPKFYENLRRSFEE